MLVRRCDIALLPVMQGRPSAGLAADPEHLDGGFWGLLDPRRLGTHERVLNVLEDRSDILGKRHDCSFFSAGIAEITISRRPIAGKAGGAKVRGWRRDA